MKYIDQCTLISGRITLAGIGSQLFVSRNISFSDKFRLFREIYPKFRLCFVHVSFHVSKHGQLVAIIAEAAILKRYNHILS